MKRIIFTGKGGVGKTTILSTVARLLAREGQRVLVVDCDPSMNLAMSLGIPIAQVIALAEDESECRSVADALDLKRDLIDAVRYDPRVVEADKKGVHLLDLANSCNSSEMALQDILRIKAQVLEA
jgi:CO dehydrogenase nickel-insertion accessory protein CooC1